MATRAKKKTSPPWDHYNKPDCNFMGTKVIRVMIVINNDINCDNDDSAGITLPQVTTARPYAATVVWCGVVWW